MMEKTNYIGVMSGTSMDGIDIVLVDFSAKAIKLVAADCFAIPTGLKEDLITLCQYKSTTLQKLGELDHQLGLVFADAINLFIDKYNIDRHLICAIGCHGQTVFHAPNGDFPFTMQIGDANIIASHTNITTVADFRRKDMALGGQGAPLVPAFHQAILSDSHKNRIVLNIGGISNITTLIPNHTMIGYDTGPGNVLLDSWIKQHLNQSYDKNAHWAKQGKVNLSLLDELLNEPYFDKKHPKSTGRELFNIDWLNEKLTHFNNLNPVDIQATLVEFTAISVANEIKKCILSPQKSNELIVCGGGASNPLIMQRLSDHLPNWTVISSNKLGFDADYMEAMAFAWLAYCRVNELPSNIPNVTGAKRKASLGVIYPSN